MVGFLESFAPVGPFGPYKAVGSFGLFSPVWPYGAVGSSGPAGTIIGPLFSRHNHKLPKYNR